MAESAEIPKEKKREIKEILCRRLKKEEGILFAYLHGSFAEGRPFRDIDVAIFVDESKVPREKASDFELLTSIELGKKIKIPVDMKIINYAPLGFQYYSTAGTLIMCRADDFRVDFLTRIRSLYFDFKPGSERFLLEMVDAE